MLKIGDHELSPDGGHPDGSKTGIFAALAPMAAVTNPPVRALVREMGCALTVTEMVSADALVRGGTEARSAMRMERAPGEDFFAVQLFGGDPETMAEAARIVESEGADVIDVNMGCPAKRIHVSGAGVSLMREPRRAAAVIDAMVKAVRLPVTAKLRAGWDDAHQNAPEVARALEDAGAQMIAVHARVKQQVHSGEARLDILRQTKEAVSVPVLGNGGVRSVEDAQRMCAESGCDGVMIGRGANGNPWLFRSIREGKAFTPDLTERMDTLRRHFDHYVTWGGEQRAVREFRKHLGWYLKGLPGAAQVRGMLPKLTSRDALMEMLAEYEEDLHSKGLGA